MSKHGVPSRRGSWPTSTPWGGQTVVSARCLTHHILFHSNFPYLAQRLWHLACVLRHLIFPENPFPASPPPLTRQRPPLAGPMLDGASKTGRLLIHGIKPYSTIAVTPEDPVDADHRIIKNTLIIPIHRQPHCLIFAAQFSIFRTMAAPGCAAVTLSVCSERHSKLPVQERRDIRGLLAFDLSLDSGAILLCALRSLRSPSLSATRPLPARRRDRCSLL